MLAIGAAAEAVAALGENGDRTPSCTIVSAVVTASAVTVGSIGDSRAYWLSADPASTGPRRLSTDDSVAAGLVELGVDERTAMSMPDAHTLTAWLGADAPAVEPHVRTFVPDGPGAVLVCSDGLWNYYPAADSLTALALPTALTRPGAAAHDLADLALAAGARTTSPSPSHRFPLSRGITDHERPLGFPDRNLPERIPACGRDAGERGGHRDRHRQLRDRHRRRAARRWPGGRGDHRRLLGQHGSRLRQARRRQERHRRSHFRGPRRRRLRGGGGYRRGAHGVSGHTVAAARHPANKAAAIAAVQQLRAGAAPPSGTGCAWPGSCSGTGTGCVTPSCSPTAATSTRRSSNSTPKSPPAPVFTSATAAASAPTGRSRNCARSRPRCSGPSISSPTPRTWWPTSRP